MLALFWGIILALCSCSFGSHDIFEIYAHDIFAHDIFGSLWPFFPPLTGLWTCFLFLYIQHMIVGSFACLSPIEEKLCETTLQNTEIPALKKR